MADYERGYKDGMAGAALPNIIDNGDKIDGYNYSYKTDSEGVPYINIDCVRAMLAKAAKSVKRGHWDYSEKENGECEWYFCSECDSPAEQLYDDNPLLSEFCPHCGADMRDDENG